MEKKYKLTDETINLNGVTLYRIEALKDFGEIKKGDKGGFIASENNLAHKGDAWVSDNACVYDNACVSGNARVYGDALVYGSACVYGDACVFEFACVYDNAWVSGNGQVYGNARVYGSAHLCGNACVYDYTRVCDNARVCGNARVDNHACVHGDARVYRDALVRGYACVCGDAEISNKPDYIVFQNWWSSGRYFTWTRSNNMWSVGCFYGTGEELIKKAYKDSSKSGRQYERIVKYVEETLKEEENGGQEI